MDPLTLAAVAIFFLTKGAEAFSQSTGEKPGAKVGGLCQAVADKFEGDSDARVNLSRLYPTLNIDATLAVQSACNKAGLWEAVSKITRAINDYQDLHGHWTQRVPVAQARLEGSKIRQKSL